MLAVNTLALRLTADATSVVRQFALAEQAAGGMTHGVQAGATAAQRSVTGLGAALDRIGTNKAITADTSDLVREVHLAERAVDNMLTGVQAGASAAQRAVTGLESAISRVGHAPTAAPSVRQAQPNRPLAAAREILDVRAFRDIERDIDQVNAAYARLAKSGTLSMGELQQASLAHQGKIAMLRREMVGFGKDVGVSAGQTAAAMRMLPAQMTDVATQLAGGQNPLLILLQQGGQVKDSFGGLRPMFAGLAAAISPVAVTVGALTGMVALLGGAAYAGANDVAELRRALHLTGNAAGLTLGRFEELVSHVRAASGATAGMAREASAAAVSLGLGSAATRDIAAAISAYGTAAGITADEAQALFKGIGKDALGWATQMNERMNFLTISTWAHIKALQEQGKGQQAASVAAAALAGHLRDTAVPLGHLDTLLKAVKSEWSEFWDAAKGAGRPETVEDKLQSVAEKLRVLRGEVKFGEKGWLLPYLDLKNAGQKKTMEDGLLSEQSKLQAQQGAERLAAQAKEATALREKETIAAAQFKDALRGQIAPMTERARLLKELDRNVMALTGTEQAWSQAQVERARQDIVARTTDQRGVAASTAAAAAAADLRLAKLAETSAQEVRVLEGKASRLDALRKQGMLGEREAAQQEAALAVDRALQQEAALRKQFDALQAKPVDAGPGGADKRRAELQKLTTEIASAAAAAERAWVDGTANVGAIDLAKARATAQEFATMFTALAARTEDLTDQIAAGQVALIRDPVQAARAQADITIQKMRRDAERLRRDYVNLIAIMRAQGQTARADMMEVQLQAFDAAQLARQQQEREKVEVDLARKAQEEWQRAASQIGDSLTDALIGAFSNGEDAGRSMLNTLKQLFSSTVLRPIVQAAMQPIANSITGVIGNALGDLLGTDSLGGVLGAVTGKSSGMDPSTYMNFGSAGASLWGGSAAYGAAIGTTTVGAGSQAAMLAAQTGVFGAEGAALTAAAAGNAGMAGAMSTLGAAMPYIGAILAVGAIIKSLDDSGTLHAGASSEYSAATGTSVWDGQGSLAGHAVQRDEVSALTDAVAQGVGSMLDAAALTFGKEAGFHVATAFADDTSKDGAWGALRITRGDDEVVDWKDTQTSRWAPKEFGDGEAGQAQYIAAVAADVRKALDEIGMPSWAQKMLDGLGNSPTIDQLGQVVTRINQTQAALKALGEALPALSKLTDEAKMAVIGSSGGLDALAANIGAYETRILSESEQASLKAGRLAEAFKRLGVAMPSDKRAFKAMVDGIDASTAAGQTMLAGMLALAGGFADAQDAAGGLAGSVGNLSQGLQDEIDRIRGIMRADKGVPLGSLQSQFAIATAQARAGDASAIEALPEISKALLDAAADQSATRLDVLRLQAQTLRSLEDTMAAVRGTTVQAEATTIGGVVADADAIAAQAPAVTAASNGDMLIELRTLRAELQSLTAQVNAASTNAAAAAAVIASNTGRVARVIERVTPDGDALAIREAAP